MANSNPSGKKKTEKYKSEFRLVIRALSKDKLALIGAVVVLSFFLISIFAPFISPYDPLISDRTVGRLAPIGTRGHLLGTDTQGRDILSRLIWAGRVSLTVALIPILISVSISLLIGMLAAYVGGALRVVVMRFLDVLFAFPMVLLAVAVAAIIGPGIMSVIIAATVVLIPFITRIVYTEAMSVFQMDFVIASRASGTKTLRMLFSELLPNVIPPVIVYSTTCIGGVIVFAAGLTFLGLGVQPPTPDWGVMCSDGKLVLLEAPHLAATSGATIVIISMAFNLVGDGLRDVVDPVLRRGRT